MTTGLEARVHRALAGVADPCMALSGLGLSIADLGLVRDVRVDGGRVEVDVTFTEVGCAFSIRILDAVERAVRALEGVGEVTVTPVWRPGWSREDLSDHARATLGEAVDRLSRLPVVQA